MFRRSLSPARRRTPACFHLYNQAERARLWPAPQYRGFDRAGVLCRGIPRDTLRLGDALGDSFEERVLCLLNWASRIPRGSRRLPETSLVQASANLGEVGKIFDLVGDAACESHYPNESAHCSAKPILAV